MAAPIIKSLAALRISSGCISLIFAEYKVFGTQFTFHGGFQYWINQFIAGGAYPFMVPVLRGLVLPHATFIAFGVAYGELAIGVFARAWNPRSSRQRLRIHLHDDAAIL